MKYFQNCKNEAEVKALYRVLAKANHPDLGGSIEAMKAINLEYEIAIKIVWAEDKDNSWKTREDISQWVKMMADLIILENVNLEMCGSWIWATGDTKPHAAAFKAHGFTWSAPKSAWYWKPYKAKARYAGRFNLDEIRAMHGSVKMSPEEEKQAAARLKLSKS